MAVAGLVLGIVGLVFGALPMPYIGVPAGVLGVIFGILGMRRASETGTGRGMAIAGLVCGALGTLLGLLWTIAFIAWIDDLNDLENEDFFGLVQLSSLAR